jgi:hypothetical protein
MQATETPLERKVMFGLVNLEMSGARRKSVPARGDIMSPFSCAKAFCFYVHNNITRNTKNN